MPQRHELVKTELLHGSVFAACVTCSCGWQARGDNVEDLKVQHEAHASAHVKPNPMSLHKGH